MKVNIEDLSTFADFTDSKELFLASIAVSLKRIADALDGALYTQDYHGRQSTVADELRRANEKS